MPSQEESQYDDRAVLQYLLGTMPPANACRLDELSIADDHFAARLSAAENDLVDSYVRGELTDEVRARFHAYYLTSPSRREKVRFAQSLRSLTDRTEEASVRGVAPQRRVWFSPAFAFAVTACCMLLAAGYLQYENEQVKQQLVRAQRELTVQRPIPETHSAPPPAASPNPTPPTMMALVLSPETRGIGPAATIALSPGAENAEFDLELESGEFTEYRVDLVDPAANTTVWRSGKLEAASRGGSKFVPVRVPATLLKSRHYSLQLTGVPTQGAGELLSAYTFRVVR
jgi:hypothetical protein